MIVAKWWVLGFLEEGADRAVICCNGWLDALAG